MNILSCYCNIWSHDSRIRLTLLMCAVILASLELLKSHSYILKYSFECIGICFCSSEFNTDALFYICNIYHSLYYHYHYFRYLLEAHSFHIIIFCELWLEIKEDTFSDQQGVVIHALDPRREIWGAVIRLSFSSLHLLSFLSAISFPSLFTL